MDEIIAYALMVMSIAYVLAPLFRSNRRFMISQTVNQNQWHEWLYRKRVALDIVADLDFDHQTGKLSEEDYRLLKDQQQRLVAQLDEKINRQIAHPRDEISRKLMAEIEKAKQQMAQRLGRICPQCGQRSTLEAKFCSQCGAKLSK